MQKPVQVVFHGVPHDAEAEQECRAEVGKLERYFDHVTACRVVVSSPSRHHAHGAPCRVQIELSVPGDRLVVSHEPGELRTVVRDAFDRARRRLEDYARKLRGDVKTHRDAAPQ